MARRKMLKPFNPHLLLMAGSQLGFPMNKDLDPRLIARMIIVSIVAEALRDKPHLKKRLVIEALDTALQGDCVHVCAEVVTALEA